MFVAPCCVVVVGSRQQVRNCGVLIDGTLFNFSPFGTVILQIRSTLKMATHEEISAHASLVENTPYIELYAD